MFHNRDELTVSKVEMAKIQLDAAIAAFFERRLVIAITLAGAAEEIFGAMLKRDGIQNSVEKIASLPPILAISDRLKDRVDYLNNVRNNLKHASDKLEDDFTIADLDAFFMIVRALGNATLLGITHSEKMNEFSNFYKSKA